jgi:nucleotide-binding universal stress UspA family protein
MDEREHVIVCGVDGSEAGQRAVQWAVEEADRRGCRLRAVTVWSWDGLESEMATSSPTEARKRAADLQDKVLTAALGERREPVVERQILEGRPSEQLCMAALDAEMIVLGSHGHGSFHDALVGSTSQHVIRHAPCPVVILPDPRRVRREHKPAHAPHRRAPRPEGIGPMF